MNQSAPAPTLDLAISLERFALTTASANEAKQVAALLLSDGFNNEAAHSVYQAASSWTCLTLRAGRQDDGLQDWMAVFNFIAAALEATHQNLATKVEAFIDLMQSSLIIGRVAEEFGDRPVRLPHALTVQG